ncbi:complement receptor type 1 [Lacerta agilis]|uniref:complement receptor type 1 n=1 Tax=Lacerta agilis TaxID=80427 RepID=UPI00141A16F2|nr:complement receptor type 1 [Lacerta agilis]
MLSPPSLCPRLLLLSSLLSGVLSDCGPPPVIHNAVPNKNIEGASFPPDSTVIYKCVGNFFNIYGKIDVVTCLQNSSWTHIEQFCVGSCMSPPRSAFAQLKKGQRKDYYPAKTTVAYLCRRGYDTIPEITPVITCRENYTWTQIPDFCKGKPCGDPGKPEHGDAVILTNFLYLAKVNFTCEDGYRLNGSPTTQCQWKKDHVEWTHKPPKCQRPTEESTEDRTTKTTGQTVPPPRGSATNNKGNCNHPHVASATLRSGDPKDSYPAGTVLRYRCIPGYEPIPGETLTLTCLDTSRWSTENPKFCQGRLCPALTFENGRIIKSTDLRLGDEITLGCNEGYRIIGENILRCTLIDSKVNWNRDVPLCQRIPCFPPPDIANGAHTGRGLDEFDYGTAVTYTCNPTFSLIGSRTITCSTAADGINGEWRPAAPECKVVSCRRPSIENGRLTTTFRATYEYNNLIMYVCEHGHTLVGSGSSRCGADSIWHPPPPKCLKGIFTTTVATAYPDKGYGNTTSNTAGPGIGGGGAGGGGDTLDPEIGSTHSPETKPPRDDTASNYSPGVIIEKLTLLLALLSLTVQLPLTQKLDWNPKPPDCSRAVFQKIGVLILKASDYASLFAVQRQQLSLNHPVRAIPYLLSSDFPGNELLTGGCGPPPRLNFAELTDEYKQKNLFPVGSTVKYMCRPGYTGLRYSSMCLQSQEWSKVLEHCKRQSCGIPGEPDNGMLIVPQDTLFGSTVNYICNEGHRLIGSTSSRKCVLSGRKVEWTNDVPLCQRIPCFPPPDVPHGKHSGRFMEDFSYGTAVTYTCEKGHPLVGNATIYCTTKDGLNGIWSGRAYCGVTHCPAPQIENGRIVTGYSATYTYNQRVTLDCNAGHKIAGSREIHCQVDGTWEPPLPHCEQVTGCVNPEIQNGRITRSTGEVKPKYTITFECDPGYILKGNHSIQCQFDSTWDSPVPICVRVIQCQPPPHVQNGMYNQEATVFTNGMFVKYTCEPGYGLIGEGTIYCTASGTWSSPAPQCEGTYFDHKTLHIGSSRSSSLLPPSISPGGSCAPPPSLQFAELLSEYKKNNSFLVGSVVKYMCHPGYAKHPGLKASLMCIRNQEWSGVQEFCKRKSCGHPGEPDNGRLIVTKDLLFGSTINYTCEEGYRLVGLSSRQCVISGLKAVWTGETAICLPISCSPPPDVPHGKHTGMYIDDFFYGTAVSYTCEKHHPLVGNATIYCTTKDGLNGVWSGRAYCGVTRCPPPQVRNGRIITGYSNTYTYNQRVTLDCNAGYKISGTREIHCQVDGTWDPPLPHCELVSQCPLPLDIPNGNHNGFPGQVFTSQKPVTYSCDPGYSLVGEASISCTASGEWSSPLPRCETVQCPPPQVVAHGKYSSQEAKGFTNGGFVEYSCDPGYSIIGDSRIFCTASGSWNSSAPNCKEIHCPSPPKVQHGKYRALGSEQYTSGKIVKYSCDPGYVLIGRATIYCTASGVWSLPVPRCEFTGCVSPKIQNGRITRSKGQVKPTETITFECDPGYILKGNHTIQCQFDSTWVSPTPICVRELQCPPPLPIPNGDHNGHGEAHFATGRYVNYTCDHGYLLRGKASSQCTTSGAWSQPLPRCEVMRCPPPPSIVHGKNIGEDLTYGSSVIYICDAGYSLDGEYLVTCILEGSNSVNWTKLPKCKGCPAPQTIANGERDPESLEDFPYGSSVTYRCDPDYFLTGTATIHCLSSGTWDQSVPHCKSKQDSTSIPLSEIQCQQPTKILNGDHSHQELSVFISGMSVNYTCEPASSSFILSEIRCQQPSKIQNGDHSHQELSVFTSGMSVKYTCEPGYSLNGEATIYCTPSGTWSAPAPHCKMIQCPSPPNVQHGNYSAPESIQHTNGKSVNYSCQPGYVLIGEATLNCTASGVWSLPAPHCEAVGCILPQISGGKKENSKTVIQIGANVTLECEDGYVLKGSSRVQCQPDFTWDPPVPVCNQGFYVSVATGIGSLVGALLLLVIAGAFCVIVIVLKRNKAKYTPASNRIYESPHLQVA